MLGILSHTQIGPAAFAKPVPRVLGPLGDTEQARVHFTVELRNHRRQQAFLVAKMMVQRTPSQAGASGEIIHRRLGVALRGEGLAGAGDQAGAGVFDHVGTGSAHG